MSLSTFLSQLDSPPKVRGIGAIFLSKLGQGFRINQAVDDERKHGNVGFDKEKKIKIKRVGGIQVK